MTQKRTTAYIFILPALLIFTLVFAVPAIGGIYYSFTNWKGMSSNIKFIGFSNFLRLFRDPVFYISIRNTLVICLVVVVFRNAAGLWLANTLHTRKVFGKAYLKAVFFIPSLLNSIVVGYTWLYILNAHNGILSYFLKGMSAATLMKYDVFLNPVTAILTICFVLVWQFSGYNMTIYLSGLQSIPKSLYEAADIDGTSNFQKFRYITLPLIVPSITVCAFLNLIGCLKTFEEVYVMTKGGPGNATETIGTFIYNSAFTGLQMGYGSAISTVLFVGILIVTSVQLRLSRRLEVQM
jgi:raffinose/stachyose/melibiose transport system permease protein